MMDFTLARVSRAWSDYIHLSALRDRAARMARERWPAVVEAERVQRFERVKNFTDEWACVAMFAAFEGALRHDIR